MPYIIEKRKSKPRISFDQAYKLRRQPEDELQARADRKASIKKSETEKSDRLRKRGVDYKPNPTSTVGLIKSRKRHGDAGRNVDKPKMTTPKAKEMERKYYASEGLISVKDVMSLHEDTSELEKRCISDVMGRAAKDQSGNPVSGSSNKLSRAYAICRASLQKSGRIKKGTAEMTKKGRGISGAKAKSKDHDAKVSKFEKAVVAARKK